MRQRSELGSNLRLTGRRRNPGVLIAAGVGRLRGVCRCRNQRSRYKGQFGHLSSPQSNGSQRKLSSYDPERRKLGKLNHAQSPTRERLVNQLRPANRD